MTGIDINSLPIKYQRQAYEQLAKKTPMNPIKKHKYNAKKTEIDGIRFDSKLEANCYTVLRDSGLRFTLQTVYEIQDGFRDNGKAIRAITYKTDFTITTEHDIYVVDAKGMKTPEFAIKYKLLLRKGTRIICCGSMKKMTQIIQLIKEDMSPFEIQKIVEAKKKKKPKLST